MQPLCLGHGTAPGGLSVNVAHTGRVTVLRLLQVTSLQAQPAKKGIEEAAAATTLQALTCAAGDHSFRRSGRRGCRIGCCSCFQGPEPFCCR